MKQKGLLGFTALMLAGLAVLIGLGVWQLQRLEWK
jgi:cytochrome oxidase assembly protein ShyY1